MEHTLELKNISKAFSGVQALNNVGFKAKSGEIVALLGENGAGKSTLLKIMSGVYTPDEGAIYLDDEKMDFSSPLDAIKHGINIIYQERQLVPYLTVMENVYMENIPSVHGVVDYKNANARTQTLIDMFELPFKATQKVGELSVSHQQMVEIIKAVRRKCPVIAFDEPTASLTETEIHGLFKIIRKLQEEGRVILYVSHRLKELFELTERIVVLKDGNYITTVNTCDTTTDELVRYMVGRELGDVYNQLERNEELGEVLLEVKDLCNENIDHVSFKLHAGEVLGFVGLVGAGRTETMRAIYGADHLSSGSIYVDGKLVKIKSPKDAMRLGMGLCPEDRKTQGLVLGSSVRENITMSVLDRVSKCGILKRDKEKKISKEAVSNFNIKTPTIEKITKELSGGNQQKVILGRWMAANPRILILDEPTKGIDVGAKAEIYQMVHNLARQGIGVIFISSELTEVINVCENVIVMYEGRVTGQFNRRTDLCTEEVILSAAMNDSGKQKV
ncbi:MAG: sugar ABC transporter ATP-binding protein [Lachnospiraceae bacterium]